MRGALARIDPGIPQSGVAALGSIACGSLHSLRRHNPRHSAPRLIDYRFGFARSHGAVGEHHGIKGGGSNPSRSYCSHSSPFYF